MTIYYPDISGFQGTISLKGALAVAAKVTEGTGFVSPAFNAQKTEAARQGTFLVAYHFLLAGNAAAQAAHAHAHAGTVPLMVDFEPEPGAGSFPSLSDCTEFIDACYWAVSRLLDAGLIRRGWQTIAWSGGKWDPRAVLRQELTQVFGAADVNLLVSSAADFGQFPRPAVPKPPPPAVITDGILVSKTMGWTGHKMKTADHGHTWTPVNP